MLIPNKIANKIKVLESDLFFKNEIPLARKRRIFYKSIRPLLDWLFSRIEENYLLEDGEIESELYILSCRLFHSFNKSKSSIIPYLEKYIVFFAQKLEIKLNKQLSRILPFEEERFDYIDEEFYWRDNNILFTDKYVGGVFTNSEKYIINRILELEDNELNKTNIAKKLSLDVKTTDRLINNLQEQWRKYVV